MSQEQRLIYVGMHDGVCAVSSGDGGKSWKQGPITSLPHAAARLSVSPLDPRRAWLAAYEAGVYRTGDGGTTWSHCDSYPSGYAHSVLADPASPDSVYVGSEPAGLFHSEDGGASWTECRSFQEVPESTNWGFHAPTRDSHVRDLVVSPVDSGLIYAGIEVGGVVRSTDGGGNWQQLPGLDDDIHCLHLGTDKQQRVYAATASALPQQQRRRRVGEDQRRPRPALHPPHRRRSRRRGPGAGDRVGKRPPQVAAVLPVDGRRPDLAARRRHRGRGRSRIDGRCLRVGPVIPRRCVRRHRRRPALPQPRPGPDLATAPGHPALGRGRSPGGGGVDFSNRHREEPGLP